MMSRELKLALVLVNGGFMVNSRSIEDLHPVVQKLCREHIEACKKRGIKIIVTSTLRDDEYQESLYQQGRTKSGNIVTNMKVTGAHGIGVAYDVVPVVNKTAVWNNNRFWEIICEEGKKLGAIWGGDWTKFVDKPHFEFTEGLTFNQIRAGQRPSFFKPKLKVSINGLIKEVESILKDGQNYVRLRDLESDKISIGWDGKMATITTRG